MAKYYYDRYRVDYSGALIHRTAPLNREDERVQSPIPYGYDVTFYSEYRVTDPPNAYPTLVGERRVNPSHPVSNWYYRDPYYSTGNNSYYQVVGNTFQAPSGKIYYQTRRMSYTLNYTRGSYIDTIIAEDGTYPNNGRVGTTYWYVKGNKAFPDFKVKAGGQLRTAEEGWVKINGVLRPIEQMWVKDNNSLKEV